jgi:5'-nucleotidase
MNILLTNDDGIQAPGLEAVYRQIARPHTVTVVAPDRERSAISHSINLHSPLRFRRLTLHGDQTGYAVNGTPADCVHLALEAICAESPDVVISGINAGANVGANIHYSGTVAAAKEAALYGLPAIAASMGAPAHAYDPAAAFVVRLAEVIVDEGLPYGTLINVNFPSCEWKGVAGISCSHQELIPLKQASVHRLDPHQRSYYWRGLDTQIVDNNNGSDISSLKKSYISITPLKCDATDYDLLPRIKSWPLDRLVQ